MTDDEFIAAVGKSLAVPGHLITAASHDSIWSSHTVVRQQFEKQTKITAESIMSAMEQMMLHLDAQQFNLVCQCCKCPMFKMRQAVKDSSVLESILQAAAQSGDEDDVLIAIDWLDENGYSEAACKLRENPKRALLAIQLAVDPKLSAVPRMQIQ